MTISEIKSLLYKYPKKDIIRKYFESGHSFIYILNEMIKNPELFYSFPSDSLCFIYFETKKCRIVG